MYTPSCQSGVKHINILPEESYGPGAALITRKINCARIVFVIGGSRRSEAPLGLLGAAERDVTRGRSRGGEDFEGNAAIKQEVKSRETESVTESDGGCSPIGIQDRRTEHISGKKKRSGTMSIILLEPRMSRNLRPPYF